MTSQQQIERFQEISGCIDSNEAHSYLENCKGNLEQAINLFFNKQLRTKKKVVENDTNPTTSKKNSELVNISDDEDIYNVKDTEFVRAPIAPVCGPIIEQSFYQSYGVRKGPTNPIFEQYHDFQQIADQQDNFLKQKLASNKNERKKKQDSSSLSNLSLETLKSSDAIIDVKKTKNLKSLFRPPIEITFNDSWDNALIEGRRRSIWLLVNVQMAAEFSCQVLNRDIWSQHTVWEILQSNFLFWQVYHDSSDGVRVCNYYNIHSFPAIFIVDPRTGEEVIKLRAQDPVSFLDQITAFLEQYPTFVARDKQLCGDKKENPISAENDKNRRRKHEERNELSFNYLEEDFENSASTQAKRMKRIVNINDDEVNDNMFTDEIISSNCATKNEWKSFLGSHNSSVIHLLLRLPDGNKQNIEAPSTAKLKLIFAYLASKDLNSNEYQIVLNYPKRIYTVNDVNKTFGELNFKEQEFLFIEKI